MSIKLNFCLIYHSGNAARSAHIGEEKLRHLPGDFCIYYGLIMPMGDAAHSSNSRKLLFVQPLGAQPLPR
jgi:hypothetical protein